MKRKRTEWYGETNAATHVSESDSLGTRILGRIVILFRGMTIGGTDLVSGKGKAVPSQAWTGPEGSKRLRLPDFKTIDTLRW